MWTSLDTLRPFGELLVAWMLTYALHSSLLVLMASLTTWWLRRRHLSVQETAWKLALLGGLVTASLQVGLGITPLTGSWALGLESPPTELVAPAAEIPEAELPFPTPRPVVEATPIVTPATTLATTRTAPPVAWTVAVSGAWLGVGIVLCLLLVISYLRLAYRLRGRTEITSGRLPRVLARLLGKISRPIRMTTTHRLRIPIAKGVIRREICLPRRAINDLTPEQQETLLAHEAAHLLHRDPFWLALARFVENLFFFQPLNRLARRRMQEISEFRCDDWTVERTGRPLTLARCLTEVAGWNVGTATPIPAPGMAQDTSGLGSRVRRLLDRGYPRPQEKQPRWLQPVLAAMLMVIVVSAPGISLAGGETEPPPEPPPAPEIPVSDVAEPVPPVPPAPPETVAPVAVAAPTPVAVLAPAPAAAPAPAPVPRLALAAAPATPVSTSAAVLAPQAVDETSDEAEETIHELEVEELLEEIEESLEDIEDEIDEELEYVEEEIEEELEAVEEQYEEQLESYEEEFDEQMDELDDELDALEDRVEERLEYEGSERKEAAFEREIEDFEERAERRLEKLEDQLEIIEDRYDERIDATIDSAIEDHLEAELDALESRLERHQVELERLAHEAARKARTEGLSDADLDQLRTEARRIATEARPSAAEMEELKSQLRRAGEEAKRAVAEADLDRAEVEAALEAWRSDYRVELEKLRAELQSLQSKYN
jgi:beta-lactamase regulating signal transducer with metallopeptidase domain